MTERERLSDLIQSLPEEQVRTAALLIEFLAAEAAMPEQQDSYPVGAPFPSMIGEPVSSARLAPDILRRVSEDKERILVAAGSGPAAALIPLEDFAALLDYEDREDLVAAEEARAEIEAEGTVSWEQVKAELGL